MNRGLPSMTALLGLLAIAGYQNRDKLAELLGGGGGSPQPAAGGAGAAGSAPSSGGGVTGVLSGLGSLGGLFSSLGLSTGSDAGTGTGTGSGQAGAHPDHVVNGGLRELIDRFRQTGHGEDADSWVSSGPNREMPADQLEHAIGPEVLATLSQQTGLSREELLARLTRELPGAVDRYTPDGRLPG